LKVFAKLFVNEEVKIGSRQDLALKEVSISWYLACLTKTREF